MLEQIARHTPPEKATLQIFAYQVFKEEGIATVKILDLAGPPQHPVYPNKPLNILLGCIAGLIAGIGAASLFEYFDHSFKSVDDVERFLKLPVLGAIPKSATGRVPKGRKP